MSRASPYPPPPSHATPPPVGQPAYSAPHYPPSRRSSYPTFLSLQDTAWIHLRCAFRGLVDAFRWDLVVRLATHDLEVRANLFKSLMLNCLSLTSIYFFDLLLSPLAQGQQKWLHRNVGWFYQILWLLPVVGFSFYLNSSWCTLIAKRAYTLQYGSRSAAPPPATYSGMLNSLATSAYRAVMVSTSVVLSFALGYLPIVGPTASFIFLCWIDAYYCFEFVWIARGLSLSRRVRHLEERWAYYLAFGLPTTALCMWGSSLANAALFALFFPSYIIMAMHARPLPLDPYNPSASSAQGGGDADARYPSPLVPIRIPVFAPVIFLNDWIVRILSVGTAGPAHRRVPSESAESIEEGGGEERTRGEKARERVRLRPSGSGGARHVSRKQD